MLSTTIRYSTLPENSHSVSLVPAHPPHRDLACEPALPVVHFYEADPDVPGAYRYDPEDSASYDLSVPDSDPRSPRYEPPHLRHQPGDTWEIGGKPYDPLDPGPYGSPGWYQDQRTGRHRRGELPDPLPADEPDRYPTPNPSPVRFPSPASTRTPAESPTPPPSPPIEEAGPRPYRLTPSHRSRRRWEDPERGPEADPRDIPGGEDPPYRFSPLREGAMERFLELSQPFREAHFQPAVPSLGERLTLVLRWLVWVVACGLVPAPGPLDTGRGGVWAMSAPDTDTGAGVPLSDWEWSRAASVPSSVAGFAAGRPAAEGGAW